LYDGDADDDTEDYLATGGAATAVLPSSWPTASGYQMVPTLYAADAATAAAAGGFYNQTAFVPQLAVTQMPQVRRSGQSRVRVELTVAECSGGLRNFEKGRRNTTYQLRRHLSQMQTTAY